MGIHHLANQANDFTSENAESTSGTSLDAASGVRN
jgi:hypothetical protein